MKRPEPKAAVQVGGRPMAARVADAMRGAGVSRLVAVVGHRAEDVRAAIGDGVEYVVQEEQLGTGHAARCAQPALEDWNGPVVIAHADIPLLSVRDVATLVERHVATGAAGTLLTAIFDEPGTLGRIVRRPDGSVAAIVEARDATAEQLEITEINVAVYCFRLPLLFDVLAEVRSDNAQNQYYLTDAIGILVGRGERIEAVTVEAAENGMGVDTAEDLARARQVWKAEQVL
jgi:bifunctional UDP-N-acetylglucosamine pyrophosphorylase/glucosamine-1-phosphate N-acetyltransferase